MLRRYPIRTISSNIFRQTAISHNHLIMTTDKNFPLRKRKLPLFIYRE